MTSNNNDEQIKSYFATKAEDLDCFKAGYIVFNMTNSICKSLNQPINEIKILSTKDKPIQTGIKSNKYFILIFQLLFIPQFRLEWIKNYRNQFLDAKHLQKEIDDFMKNYDLEQQKVLYLFLTN